MICRTGAVSAHLSASSSAVDTDWVVRLCDVFPDGRSLNVVEGIQRARFRGVGLSAASFTAAGPYL